MKAKSDLDMFEEGDELIVFNRKAISLPRVKGGLTELLPAGHHKFRIESVTSGQTNQCWLVKGAKAQKFGAHINWWKWVISLPNAKITIHPC